jgi:hypothetical protein
MKAFECIPYSPDLRARLLRACANEADVREVARLNVAVGEAFAEAARWFLPSTDAPIDWVSRPNNRAFAE